MPTVGSDITHTCQERMSRVLTTVITPFGRFYFSKSLFYTVPGSISEEDECNIKRSPVLNRWCPGIKVQSELVWWQTKRFTMPGLS